MNIFPKTTLALILISVNACSLKYNPFKLNDSKAEIRIVDINGNYKPIKKHVPILNSALIDRKKNLIAYERLTKEQELLTENNNDREIKEDFADNFGPSSESLMVDNSNTFKKEEQKVRYNNQSNQKAKLDIESELINKNNKPKANIKDKKDIIKKIKPTKIFKTFSNAKNSKPAKIFKTSNQKSSKGIFVQIGSFSSKAGADSTFNKAKNISPALIKEVKVGKKTMNKVLLGPVTNNYQARSLLKKSKINGFTDAFIVKIK